MMDSDFSEDEQEEVTEQAEKGEGGYQTLAHGVLSPASSSFCSPRSTRCFGGKLKKVGYSDSRISVLKKNPHISQEIMRLQEQNIRRDHRAEAKEFRHTFSRRHPGCSPR